ncbi:MAG TPA: hypothetical protein VN976_12340 [Verrucomicrobiae bacterium]|nr:hypothetical protein [Verrucomicrobiae bacterium]
MGKDWKFWIRLLGPVIVFITFVVKEDMRDAVRAEVAKIDLGRSLLAVHTDVLNVGLSLIDEAEMRIERDRNNGRQKQSLSSERFHVLVGGYVLVQDALTSMNRLVSVLPDRPNELNSTMEKANDELNEVEKRVKLVTNDPTTLDKQEPGIHEALFTLRKKWEPLSHKIDDEADEEMKQLLEKSEFYEKASWGLYFLGFILALTGKIYALDTANETTDQP